MLAKPTDNVLPIEGTSRLTGRHLGAILGSSCGHGVWVRTPCVTSWRTPGSTSP